MAVKRKARGISRGVQLSLDVDREQSLAPKAHTIHSLVSQRMTVHDALAELVDNSFAPGKGGADGIWIDVRPDRERCSEHDTSLRT
jgi:hypothetical protein